MKNDMKLTPAAVSAAARGDLENFMVAATPGGIERQEAMGQAALVGTKNTLPKECPRVQLEKLGFVFGNDVDDLFVNVTFPAGWSKKATDHSMWSDLLDAKGRKRGSIFYKAAFYDRSSHMGLNQRYTCGSQYLNADLTPFEWGNGAQPAKQWIAVTDHATGEILWHSEAWSDKERNWKAQDAHKDAGNKWLTEHFQQFAETSAYWDV